MWNSSRIIHIILIIKHCEEIGMEGLGERGGGGEKKGKDREREREREQMRARCL